MCLSELSLASNWEIIHTKSHFYNPGVCAVFVVFLESAIKVTTAVVSTERQPQRLNYNQKQFLPLLDRIPQFLPLRETIL